MTYYIYEIPGIKNGATKHSKYRRDYNFIKYNIEPIIVETMEGPDTPEYWQVVGDREWYYADLNGYPRGVHYRKMHERGVKGLANRTYTKDQFEKMIDSRRANGNMSNGAIAARTTKPKLDKLVIKDREKGMSQNKLAAKYKLGRAVIRRILQYA